MPMIKQSVDRYIIQPLHYLSVLSICVIILMGSSTMASNKDHLSSSNEHEYPSSNINKSILIQQAEPCSIAFEGIDPKTKQFKVETSSEFLFDYTPAKLVQIYQDKSFLEAYSKFTILGNQLYLILNITIHSKQAPYTYGQIDPNSILKVQFINGQDKYIKSSSNATGQKKLNGVKYKTEYEVIYRMTKETMNLFMDQEIDKIGLMWSSGYENYNVFYVDRLKQQAKCILNK